METTDHSRLEELGGSGYEIADGQPDIKGWNVFTADGKLVGEVDELLFNPLAGKVRYLVVDMDENHLNLGSKHVLVPIGIASLHESDDTVIIPDVTAKHFVDLPAYEGGTVDAGFENRIRDIFGQQTTQPASGHDFYDHHHFDQDRFYGKRWPFSADQAAFPLHGQDSTSDQAEGDMPPPPREEPPPYNGI